MVPSSDEETESDDVGLRPRKVHMIVSTSRLLGSIGDVLGSTVPASMQRNKVVIPNSVMSHPLSFTTTSPIDLRSDSSVGSALGSPQGSHSVKEAFSGGQNKNYA